MPKKLRFKVGMIFQEPQREHKTFREMVTYAKKQFRSKEPDLADKIQFNL